MYTGYAPLPSMNTLLIDLLNDWILRIIVQGDKLCTLLIGERRSISTVYIETISPIDTKKRETSSQTTPWWALMHFGNNEMTKMKLKANLQNKKIQLMNAFVPTSFHKFRINYILCRVSFFFSQWLRLRSHYKKYSRSTQLSNIIDQLPRSQKTFNANAFSLKKPCAVQFNAMKFCPNH